MKFTATVEGYGGTQEYDSIEKFTKTIRSFISEADNSEVIKFTLFDIKGKKNILSIPEKEKEEKEEEGGIMTMEKNYEVKKKKIIEEIEDIISGDDNRWVSADEINMSMQIGVSTLNRYLKKMREESLIRFQKQNNRYAYRPLKTLNFGGGMESEAEPTLKSPIENLDISGLIKMNEDGLLSEKGKDILIDALIKENE